MFQTLCQLALAVIAIYAGWIDVRDPVTRKLTTHGVRLVLIVIVLTFYTLWRSNEDSEAAEARIDDLQRTIIANYSSELKERQYQTHCTARIKKAYLWFMLELRSCEDDVSLATDDKQYLTTIEGHLKLLQDNYRHYVDENIAITLDVPLAEQRFNIALWLDAGNSYIEECRTFLKARPTKVAALNSVTDCIRKVRSSTTEFQTIFLVWLDDEFSNRLGNLVTSQPAHPQDLL